MDAPPQPWPTGHAERLEPLVARVLAANSGPFTYTGTQSYVVGDARGVVVIDPGPDEPGHLAALAAAVGEAPVIAIACTHTHRDHSPAAAPLAQQTGAPIIGCAPLAIADIVPPEWRRHAEAAFDGAYAPCRVLADGELISGPGWHLNAVATPGHTSNHLCFALDAGDGAPPALFSGDHVMGWSTTVIIPPDGDMGAYMASLEKLHARDDRVYYPAHGPVITNPRQLVRGMIGHRRQREGEILRQVRAGTDTIPALVARLYKGLDDRLVMAAGLTVLAHLTDLERRGIATHAGEIWSAA